MRQCCAVLYCSLGWKASQRDNQAFEVNFLFLGGILFTFDSVRMSIHSGCGLEQKDFEGGQPEPDLSLPTSKAYVESAEKLQVLRPRASPPQQAKTACRG